MAVTPDATEPTTTDAAAPVAEHFAEVADSWVARYRDRPSFRHRLAVVGRLVAEVVDQHDAPRVLDFGGGPGVFSQVASAGASAVVCLDVSEAMVLAGAARQAEIAELVSGIARPRPERIERLVGPLDALAGDDRFDVVLAVAVLEYLPDPAATLTRLAGLVRPDGHLVLTVPNPRSWWRRAEDLAGSLGAEAGRVLRSERLRSRAYAGTRPHGNQVPWEAGIEGTGLVLERRAALTLAGGGWLSRVAATHIVVLRRRW